MRMILKKLSKADSNADAKVVVFRATTKFFANYLTISR